MSRKKWIAPNLHELVKWGRETLALIDDPCRLEAAPFKVSMERVRAKLGWLVEFREALHATESRGEPAPRLPPRRSRGDSPRRVLRRPSRRADRYTRVAAQTHDSLVIGDSVVWGQYVTREQTLTHYLNELAGRRRFANLGLDGAHPIALTGLIEHHASGIRNKPVLLQFNPLWLSSPRHDLSSDEESQFNHPKLVPQFVPWLAPYKDAISPRIGVVVERRISARARGRLSCG